MAIQVKELIDRLERYEEHIEVYVQQQGKSGTKLVSCTGVYLHSPVNGKEKVIISII